MTEKSFVETLTREQAETLRNLIQNNKQGKIIHIITDFILDKKKEAIKIHCRSSPTQYKKRFPKLEFYTIGLGEDRGLLVIKKKVRK